jgi:hypothetical protein
VGSLGAEKAARGEDGAELSHLRDSLMDREAGQPPSALVAHCEKGLAKFARPPLYSLAFSAYRTKIVLAKGRR